MATVINTPYYSGIGTFDVMNSSISVVMDYWTKLEGDLSADCNTLKWSSQSVGVLLWIRRSVRVKKVHVVFMNHLDVGYNGISPHTGYINNVLNTYFHGHFMRALALIDTIQTLNLSETFIYTTHSWLVSMYLDCPENLVLSGVKLLCPSSTDVARFKTAVANGYITWHAGPFNLQPENMDASLFEYGVSIGVDLDAQFGIKRSTLVLSQRDVPGMTRSVIPLLKRSGVTAITVGENFGAPSVGEKAFVWEDPKSGQSILAMWHPFGYGGIGLKDCVITSNGHALAFAFRTDNSGPVASVQELLDTYAQLKAQFPEAEIRASTFENFVTEGLAPSASTLPRVRGEIGDVWIQGVASDPRKMAEFRIMSRLRSECLAKGECLSSDERIRAFSRFLIKIPEHTWGLPGVYDNANWSNELFEKARGGLNYRNCEAAWAEQRFFNVLALDALGDHPLAEHIRGELKQLDSVVPNVDGMQSIRDLATTLTCGTSSGLAFDGERGAIVSLYDSTTEWASIARPKGTFMYSTLNSSDFQYMQEYYGQNAGYSKPNSSCAEAGCANPQDGRYFGKMTHLWWYNSSSVSCRAVVKLSMPDEAYVKYGAPRVVYIEVEVSRSAKLLVDIRLTYLNKTSTRLPEQIFYEFADEVGSVWSMDKLGEGVEPTEVMLNGSQYQHAVWQGVTVQRRTQKSRLLIETVDAPLVAVMTNETPYRGWSGTPNTMPVPLKPLKSSQIVGMASALFSNVWNTNYILWSLESDSTFRYRLMSS